MATHSRTVAWKILWTEKPSRLQSMGLLRVGLDWATSLSLFTFMLWRGKWQPTPVFLPGESQGWGSLVGCCLWGHTELDTTEMTYQQQQKSSGVTPSTIFFLFLFYTCYEFIAVLSLYKIQNHLFSFIKMIARLSWNCIGSTEKELCCNNIDLANH